MKRLIIALMVLSSLSFAQDYEPKKSPKPTSEKIHGDMANGICPNSGNLPDVKGPAILDNSDIDGINPHLGSQV